MFKLLFVFAVSFALISSVAFSQTRGESLRNVQSVRTASQLNNRSLIVKGQDMEFQIFVSVPDGATARLKETAADLKDALSSCEKMALIAMNQPQVYKFAVMLPVANAGNGMKSFHALKSADGNRGDTAHLECQLSRAD